MAPVHLSVMDSDITLLMEHKGKNYIRCGTNMRFCEEQGSDSFSLIAILSVKENNLSMTILPQLLFLCCSFKPHSFSQSVTGLVCFNIS